MCIEKKYFNGRHICKVTFNLPWEAAEFATTVHIVGDFNNWNLQATPMRRLKDGAFTVTIDLERSKEYQFRYLIDFAKWENDTNADKYVPSPYGKSENSVIVV
jgi:1,4-alpha-glucan branching enzyme